MRNKQLNGSKARSDLFLIVLFISIILFLSMYIDMHERFIDFVESYEAWELDEIIASGAFAIAVSMVWYGWRRLRESIQFSKIIQNSESRFRSLVDSTDDSIYLVDKDLHYLFMNKQHISRIGTDEKYIGKPFSNFHSPEETDLFAGKVKSALEHKTSEQYEYKSLRDGRYFLQTYSPVIENNNVTEAVTIVSKDITGRKKMEEELREMSLTDELTKLYNRRGLEVLGEQYLIMSARENRGLYILYADLDNMKVINDKLGHHEGDQALIKTAGILKECFRKSDIIARLGGDEFAVFPVGFAGDNVENITARLLANITAFNLKSPDIYKLSLSFGISFFDPQKPSSLDELLAKADRLMYKDKRQKKEASL
jgi:diguanylate cyclase (GGDEF)-like protein/PAS domain S-box-containing protein